MGEDRIRAFDLSSDSICFPTQWSLQNQARHGAASPPDVRRTQAMESGEHAGPGVLVPPSLGKPRMGGECLSAPNPSIICLPTVLRFTKHNSPPIL